MKAKEEKREVRTPLQRAYDAVVKLRYTQSKLIGMYPGVNHHTLGRIKDGLPVKKVTEHFYLCLFVGIINKEYERRMHKGGDGARELLVDLKNILLASLDLLEVER